MWGNHEGMGWWWIFGSVWMVLIWAAIISLVVWVTKKLSTDRKEPHETPLEIAQIRLARGEINKKQYEVLIDSLAQ